MDTIRFEENFTLPHLNERLKVLVTGAGGNIGRYFSQHNAERYDLRLMVHQPEDIDSELKQWGEVVVADITDLEQFKSAAKGMHTILHLAGNPSPSADWASLLPSNIIGTYNAFAAAKFCNVRRVVFASSIHAVSGYPVDRQVQASDPVNPGDLYGVSKCFGEALARYMAEQEGLSCLVIRIGAFQPHSEARKEKGIGMLDAWVSQRDLNQLIQQCIDVQGLKFGIFNGLSNNRFKRLDLHQACQILGYRPQDDLFHTHPELANLDLDHRIHAHNVADPHHESGVKDQKVTVQPTPP